MYLMSVTDRVFETLKGSEALSDCVIIRAFPFAKKPTRLIHSIITVSPDRTEFKNIALGGECAFGTFAVAVDVFSPQEFGSPVTSGVCDNVIKALLETKPVKISVSPYSEEDDLGAFRVRCTAYYSERFEI